MSLRQAALFVTELFSFFTLAVKKGQLLVFEIRARRDLQRCLQAWKPVVDTDGGPRAGFVDLNERNTTSISCWGASGADRVVQLVADLR